MEEKQVILVVDDDREIVRVLGKLLELEGYQVFSAYDGMEAPGTSFHGKGASDHPGCDDAEA